MFRQKIENSSVRRKLVDLLSMSCKKIHSFMLTIQYKNVATDHAEEEINEREVTELEFVSDCQCPM